MKYINRCIICNEKKFSAYKSYIAPFIIERVNISNPKQNIKLLVCKNCKVSFFNVRFEDKEIANLYSGYRGEEYQQQRQKHEQIYTEEFNDKLGNDTLEIQNRKNNLLRLLKEHTEISNIKNILDYGGDRGQFFPNELVKSKKYVYDLSDVKLIDNINKIENIKDLKNHNWDLIMCSYVLEHLSYPMDIMKIFDSISRKNSFLYIEVPYDYPGKTLRGVAKLKNFLKKYIGYYQAMHEHINFFDKKSIKKMLDLNNFEILSNKIIEQENNLGKVKIISCLAKKK